jgi:hypothetical protein
MDIVILVLVKHVQIVKLIADLALRDYIAEMEIVIMEKLVILVLEIVEVV